MTANAKIIRETRLKSGDLAFVAILSDKRVRVGFEGAFVTSGSAAFQEFAASADALTENGFLSRCARCIGGDEA
jgi:hypothetical protein